MNTTQNNAKDFENFFFLFLLLGHAVSQMGS